MNLDTEPINEKKNYLKEIFLKLSSGYPMIIGVLALLIPFCVGYVNDKLVSKNYIETEGILIGYEKEGISDNKTYTPIYEYTVDNQKYKIKPNIIGDFLNDSNEVVKYNPNNPDEAIIESKKFDIVNSIIIIITVFLIISAIYGIMHRKAEKESIN